MKSTGDPLIEALYSVRKGKVEYVDVPEPGFLVVDGGGDPGGEAFHDAIQALYSESCFRTILLQPIEPASDATVRY